MGIHALQNAEIGNRFRQIFCLHEIRLFGYCVPSVVGRRNNKKNPCDVFEEIVIYSQGLAIGGDSCSVKRFWFISSELDN